MKKMVSFKHVFKKFKVYEDKPSTLKEFVTRIKILKYRKNDILDDVSFDVYKGQVVGIVGNNGAGKSTILKLISKIMFPDNGQIEVNGKVSSLLELGAGFDENFTGRQNIYFNASILGLSKSKIDEIIDEVIEFADIREYIDCPVRTYSSGMYMRLAFSVAINVDADIILIDEVLAVGDQEFQQKCLNKVKQLQENKKTILFISHDMNAVRKVCTRVLWLKDKKIVMDGKPDIVVSKYLESEGIIE